MAEFYAVFYVSVASNLVSVGIYNSFCEHANVKGFALRPVCTNFFLPRSKFRPGSYYSIYQCALAYRF